MCSPIRISHPLLVPHVMRIHYWMCYGVKKNWVEIIMTRIWILDIFLSSLSPNRHFLTYIIESSWPPQPSCSNSFYDSCTALLKRNGRAEPLAIKDSVPVSSILNTCYTLPEPIYWSQKFLCRFQYGVCRTKD